MNRRLWCIPFLCAFVGCVLAEPRVVRATGENGQMVIMPHDDDREIQWVTGDIAIGNINAAYNVPHLLEQGVTDVISLIGRVASYAEWPPLESTEIDVEDTPNQNMLDAFQRANDVIKRVLADGGRVMVHCAAGVSRSSSTIIYHLMVERDMSYDAALDLVRKARHVVQPNRGFEAQLRALERDREKNEL